MLIEINIISFLISYIFSERWKYRNIVRLFFSLFFPAFLHINKDPNKDQCQLCHGVKQSTTHRQEYPRRCVHCYTLKGRTLFEQYSIKVSKSQPLHGRISTTVYVNPQQMYQGSISNAVNGKSRKKKREKKRKEKKSKQYPEFYKAMESFVRR